MIVTATPWGGERNTDVIEGTMTWPRTLPAGLGGGSSNYLAVPLERRVVAGVVEEGEEVKEGVEGGGGGAGIARMLTTSAGGSSIVHDLTD